jgi:hypothetical protein
MSRNERQHSVPQCHLRKFAFDGKRLWVFDKCKQRVFAASTRDVAVARHFNNIPDRLLEDGVDAEVGDRALTGVEEIYSRHVEALLGRVERARNSRFRRWTRVLHPCHKQLLAHCVAKQMLRTEGYWHQCERMLENGLLSLAHTELRLHGLDDGVDVQVEWDRDMAKLDHLRLLFDTDLIRDLVNIAGSHIWFVGVNNSPIPLYTSDDPVVSRSYDTSKSGRGVGWASPGVEISFPLSPRYILIMCDKGYFRQWRRWDGKLKDLEPDNVVYYNSLRVLHCHRQVYCPEDCFDIARQVCRDRGGQEGSKL